MTSEEREKTLIELRDTAAKILVDMKALASTKFDGAIVDLAVVQDRRQTLDEERTRTLQAAWLEDHATASRALSIAEKALQTTIEIVGAIRTLYTAPPATPPPPAPPALTTGE